MKLTIDRARWLRGEGSNGMLFRPSDGRMCCLGFLGRACGFSELTMEKQGEPYPWTEDEGAEWPKGTFVLAADRAYEGKVSNIISGLIEVNDVKGTPGAVREAKITKLMLRLGVEVEFVGEDAP